MRFRVEIALMLANKLCGLQANALITYPKMRFDRFAMPAICALFRRSYLEPNHMFTHF
ncbi:hypothetical protein Z945_7 [Sulfitobacter noctilucae]|nr:hypothetical protein Z945_7 [Sulfitobacter noctilucae]